MATESAEPCPGPRFSDILRSLGDDNEPGAVDAAAVDTVEDTVDTVDPPTKKRRKSRVISFEDSLKEVDCVEDTAESTTVTTGAASVSDSVGDAASPGGDAGAAGAHICTMQRCFECKQRTNPETRIAQCLTCKSYFKVTFHIEKL